MSIACTDFENEHLDNGSVEFHSWYDMCCMEKEIGPHDKDMEPIKRFIDL